MQRQTQIMRWCEEKDTKEEDGHVIMKAETRLSNLQMEHQENWLHQELGERRGIDSSLEPSERRTNLPTSWFWNSSIQNH